MIRRVFRLGRGLARFAINEVKERIDRRDQQPNAPMPANPGKEDLHQNADLAPVGHIDAKALWPLLDEGAVVLLDCRELHEWEAGYIDPCVHIPMNDLPERHGELDPARTTVVYCLHGMRSAEVAAWLAHEKGFADVRSLDGGIVAWYSEYDQQRIVVTRNEDH